MIVQIYSTSWGKYPCRPLNEFVSEILSSSPSSSPKYLGDLTNLLVNKGLLTVEEIADILPTDLKFGTME